MTNRPTPRWILPIAAALVLTITAICWAQETILPDALVWPQFVVGELPDGTTYEVEFLIANTNPDEDWSGEILLADQFFFPADDVDIIELGEDEAQGSNLTSTS